MKVTRIEDTLRYERVVGVQPEIGPRVEEEERWSARLNFHTGRTLTHTALETEQDHRGGRLALMGRQFSPGVVEGLELGFENPPVGEPTFLLSPGVGITHSGEDLSLARPLRVRVEHLPQVYAMGPPRPIAGAGVVVLQPVEAFTMPGESSDDPCEIDPEEDAFADWQLADGCRLAWYPWPEEGWFGLHPESFHQSRLRDRLTQLTFRREAETGRLPWEQAGLALGLALIRSNGRVEFIARHAVVRQGGSTLRPARMFPGRGTPFLWQARLEAFTDHLQELLDEGMALDQAMKHFRYLPPVGSLPISALDINPGQFHSPVLPAHFQLEAVPVPEEQLEAVLEAAASLEPFDLTLPDRMKLLVPVPQSLFEPRLLLQEQVDPVFTETLRELLHELAGWLGRRAALRVMAPRVQGALDPADVSSYPSSDPEALPGERTETASASQSYGTQARDVVSQLHYRLRDNSPLTAAELAVVNPGANANTSYPAKYLGLTSFIDSLEEKIVVTENILYMGFRRVESETHRVRQLLTGGEEASKLAVNPIFARVTKGFTGYASQEQVKAYFQKRGNPRVQAGGSLVTSPAKEAKQQAVATKAAILAEIARAPINLKGLTLQLTGPDKAVVRESTLNRWREGLDDLSARIITDRIRSSGRKGFRRFTVDLGPFTAAEKKEFYESATGDDSMKATRAALNIMVGWNRFGLAKTGLRSLVLADVFDPDPFEGDEAAYLKAASGALQHALEALQKLRERVGEYKQAVQSCKVSLKKVHTIHHAWESELENVDQKIDELRHDIGVARALRAEEVERVESINQLRLDTLQEHVQVIFFMRPRTTSLRLDTPAITMHGVFEDPVPACLREDAEAPDELQEMLDLFRDIPLEWLPAIRKLVVQLDRPERLHHAFKVARERASLLQVRYHGGNKTATPPGRYGKAIQGLMAHYRSGALQMVQQRAVFDLKVLQGMSWKGVSKRAEKELSLDDLVEAGRGRSGMARQAIAELERLEDISVCLYERVGEVAPAVRLQWADRLSAFDRPMKLDDLSRLPHWEDVAFNLRRELQRLSDWLFSRVDSKIDDAVALVNDLVRVCILLASHAPVSGIVSGHVTEPVAGKEGDTIDLSLDKGKVAVGMKVNLFQGLATVVQGLVMDLGENTAKVKVTQASKTGFRLEQGTVARFMWGGGFKR